MERLSPFFSSFATLSILWAITVSPALAQQPATPAFEVVTIKPASPDDTNWRMEFNPGLMRIENRSVRDLIKFAYDLKSNTQLLNATGWLLTDHFDILGKEDESLSNTLETVPLAQRQALMRQLVRGILEDRFQLQAHTKIAEIPAFVLVVARGGAKIKPFQPTGGHGFRGLLGPTGRIDARGAPMQMLADRLSSAPETSGRVVLDKTGMTGDFDWSLRWTSETLATAEAAQPDADAPPNLFTALQEQLGLKLESQKASIQALFLDHVEKPTAN